MPNYLECKEVSGTTGSVDATYNRTYARNFRVIVDDPLAGPYFAGSHPDLPRIYSPHPEDRYAFCVGLVPARDNEDMTVWHVSATYAYSIDSRVPLASPGGAAAPSPPTSSGGGNPATDSQQKGIPPAERKQHPLDRKHDISYSSVKIRTVPVDEEPYAMDGKAIRSIRNAAGDPFQDQPSKDIFALQITIGLNSLTVPDQAWLNRIGTLNQNPVEIDGVTYGARELRMEPWSAQRAFEDGISYLRWTLTVTQRPHWRVELRNSGFRAVYPVMDANGLPVPGAPDDIRAPNPEERIPVPMDLDEFGKYLPPATIGGALVSKPKYIEFNVIPETSWPTPL